MYKIIYWLMMIGSWADDTCAETGAKIRTSNERHLLKCLLHKDYDPAVRPASSPSEPVNVVVDSIIAAIIDLVSF